MSGQNSEKVDYSNTLNLPRTDFSMKAGLVQKEPEFLKKWEQQGLWDLIKRKSQGKPKFTLHDGPPYANGNIHIGHALNKILKDMIVKFRTMEGKNSFYVPGWDCHGLPIEHQLLKDQKKKKGDVDFVQFRKDAHDYAMNFVGIQREQFKRLGVFAEWDKPYLTLDPEYEYWILKSLAELRKKGYVERGLKPVNWCSHCETALAEAEVEYEDRTSPTVFVKFRTNPSVFDSTTQGKPLSLLIWTTTPWTLLANVAVAVHPAFTYALVDLGGEVIVVEDSLKEKVLAKAGIENFKVLKKVSGQELTVLTYQHPFGIINNCRVVTADYVTKEDGTGLVHTAPGHGQDDFSTGVKYGLEVLMPVNDRGIYTKQAGSYEGQFVFKANPNIIEELKSKGKLLYTEDIQHSYPHCWRCKSPVIFRATHQWFLKIDHNGLREKLREAVDQVQWIPEGGKDRILGMVVNRPDWCLSRQRFWGVPIPALKTKNSDDLTLDPQVIEKFAEIVRKEGSDAWFKRDVKDFIPEGSTLKASELENTFDILDVWFDSGVSSQAVVKARLKEELPTDLYLEGSDQHRGWFQSSLIPAVALEGKPPFKSVLTHGFVVDGQGRKMSKSLGNVVSPHDIIKNSGADIIRLWVASSSYNEDVRVSAEILDRLVDAYRKIRNTLRYLLGNLNGYDPDKDIVAYDKMLDVDKWALLRLYSTIHNAKRLYDKYEFSKVYQLIYSFCNDDLSGFYLDILKDRLYTSASNSLERRSAQTVLYYISDHLIRVLAPILSFTAEEVFGHLPKNKAVKDVQSVHLLDWNSIVDQWNDLKVEEHFKILIELRPFVLKALEEKRQAGMIGSALEAKLVFKTVSEKIFKYLQDNKKDLPAMFVVSQVNVVKTDHIEKPLGGDFQNTEVTVEKAEGAKCDRCWNYTLDVGQQMDHPTLCARCTEIVNHVRS